ncbi:hypothetical protein CRYUN_Cryun20dG0045700 [Craigia yunnanensis]
MDKCLKFNVNGSAVGKPGPAGYGGILRNKMGSILALFPGPLGIMDSNVAEVMAIKVALEMFDRCVWKEDIGNVNRVHIYREGNYLADSLAKSGVKRSVMLEEFW